MQSSGFPSRKCAAFLTAGVGAAVCLTSSQAFAAFKSGTIAGSNGGRTAFHINNKLHALDDIVSWKCTTSGGPNLYLIASKGVGRFHVNGAFIEAFDAGVVVGASLGGFGSGVKIPLSISNKYFAVSFNSGGTHYGWLHVVSTNANGSELIVDRWGYQTTVNATCKTLTDAVSVKKLSLANGQTKLVWGNENEDGVARYEVQSQDAQGNWKTLDSRTPGDGSYSLNTPKDTTCRLVIEGVDGTTEQKNF